MLNKTRSAMNVFVLLLAVGAVGCAAKPADTQEEANKPEAAQPVTITIAAHGGAITDEEVQRYIADPVKKKYPHITVKRINIAEKGQTLRELVAAKEIPDIAANFPLNMNELVELGLHYNMDELIKKYRFDVNRVQPELVQSIKIGSDLDYLAGLPMFNQAFALFYNKELFDRFGVPYPKDNMTWEEVRDLAVKMTRSESGVQYWGLWPDGAYRGAYQVSLPWVDAKNSKPVFQSQGWQDLFNLWYSLYKIPGYPPKGTNYAKEFTTGHLAMMTDSTSTLKSMLAVKDFNWDVVTYPQNAQAPGVGQRVDSYTMAITSQSKNKDAAFQVLSVVLSDEVQTDMSRNGRLSVLKDSGIQNQFGKDIGEYSSKNVLAFTKLKLALLQSFKNLPAATIIINSFNDVLYSGKDVNTALREADEQMAKAIAELLKQPNK
jgi:multiple sugar transport system substrate-binding protein